MESRLTRGDAVLLTLLVLAALAVRAYFVQFFAVISADGIAYVNIAQDFISGRGLAGATHYPPFYPILLGLASPLFGGNFEAAGLAVSVVMGSLIVVPIYLLGVEFFSKRAGLVAAILAIAWPSLRGWSTEVMSQATYITMLLMGGYSLWIAYRKGAAIPSLFAGAFFAAAHLTRSEGVLVLFAEAAVLVLATMVQRLPLRKLLPVALCLAVFFLLFSPYLFLLHQLTGKWQLTGKSKIAIADALSMYLNRPDLKHDPSFQEIGYLDLFRRYPDYVRTNYLKNLARCWNEMLPLYGWLLAATGFFAGAFNREKAFERLYLLGTFAPLAVIVVFFFIGPEYTQAYLPVLFLCIGNGLYQALGWAMALQKESAAGAMVRYLAYVPLCLALLYGVRDAVRQLPADRHLPYHYSRDGGRFDDKQVGLKLSRTLPPDAVLITRSGRVGFYSGRRYLMPPQADFKGMVEYAKKNGITHLIATGQLLGMRPQLEFLFTPVLDPNVPFTPPPELELVAISQEPGGLPYLVYRFR